MNKPFTLTGEDTGETGYVEHIDYTQTGLRRHTAPGRKITFGAITTRSAVVTMNVNDGQDRKILQGGVVGLLAKAGLDSPRKRGKRGLK